jgi:hypothetical protein
VSDTIPAEEKTNSSGAWRLAVPALAAALVVAFGAARLLMEFVPTWVAVVIGVPVAVLVFFGIVLTLGRDSVDIVVGSAVITILVLFAVPWVLRKMHDSKTGAPRPVQEQKVR